MEVEVVEAACTEAVLYDTPISELEEAESKVADAVAEVLGAAPESIGAGWSQDGKHAIGNFLSLSPNQETRDVCAEKDNISKELRDLLKDMLPDQSRDSTELYLQGVDAEAVNDNIDDIKEALAKALGVPIGEIDITKVSATPKGVIVELEKPSCAKLPEDNWKLAEDLKKTPGLEAVEVPPIVQCPVLLLMYR
eukprot:TRINITY_DN3542_c0_g1_i1.p1 TRINITY_DN3542_c0_g1~~TRINITY_DN3542_c0_g1_i1.p1  ORF type:complete len:194 (+),score=41.48 TRINITY_DN3542_c0_g1_i1:317-898(+)